MERLIGSPLQNLLITIKPRVMETILSIILLVFIFWLGTVLIKSVPRGKCLTTVPSPIAATDGYFTLILYGGKHSNDPETIAILAKETGRYTFEPFAPKFSYVMKESVPAKEAIAEAEMFISRHSSFRQSRVSGIIDGNGAILGYELRPLYFPLTFGTEDVMDVTYTMEATKIVVHVRLNPSVEKMPSA